TGSFKLIRVIKFMYLSFACLLNNNIIIVHYFKFCEYLKKLVPWKKMLLDIRTLSVNKDAIVREKHNNKIKESCRYFNCITVVSEGVRQRLGLSKKKTSILPLGADVISTIDKDFSTLNLLYVGTLNNRNITQTIEGLSIFLKNNPKVKNITTYDIVGDGDEYSQ